MSDLKRLDVFNLDVFNRDTEGMKKLLMDAIENGDIDRFKKALKFLKENTSDVLNAKDKHGDTVLMNSLGAKEYRDALIAAGADVNFKNNDGWTALMMTGWYGLKDSADSLLNAGADVTLKNNNGQTAVDLSDSQFSDDPSTKTLLKNAELKNRVLQKRVVSPPPTNG